MTEIQPQGQERRLTFRLLSYWNRIRGARPLPSLKDVDVNEIAEMWHFCFVIDVTETDPASHKFHYFGPELSTIFSGSFMDEPVQRAIAQDIRLEHTIGFYQKALHQQEPVSESAEFYMDGREVRYRTLIVPMSSDGNTVDYLLGTTNYKIFD